MAATLLRHKIKSVTDGAAFSVDSAGLAAWAGQPASPEAVLTMAERGFSLTDHRAKQIDAAQIATNNLILTMTRSHKDSLLRLFPVARDKIFTLAEYAGGQVDVADPIGGTLLAYQVCADQLAQLVDLVWDKISRLAGKTGQNGENKPDIWRKG
jgi:protein-tyrosine phosphatase